ncbi:hypothetical protein TSTA_080890 [Talaromyces stipitatus ATCC 10500]|uniref:GRHL1/CP2 C-terminal domain-containing protein n=1 Tax=Talaromyces stipitatus (strain ATCC 10500 / CBS 375.48 / QM 6759 / NRRL 1006) TaxID=441959 RepID=B8LZS4_TALSN|nr:uncharacterized protein TSTA_080890 [Talaromyces stipitatus ATCC 10500]EED20856.1 hypothetical protein TSTA_080890 [Talaromyces stipitatus ATCC 10500]
MRWRDAISITQQVKIKKGTTGYTEALDLNPLCEPPVKRPPKPIACFYIRFPDEEKGDYYRALYLSERTVSNLTVKIAEKCKVNPGCIVRIVRVSLSGVETAVDDDIVQQVPEGQDMVAKVTEVSRLQTSTTSISTPPMATVEIRLTY